MFNKKSILRVYSHPRSGTHFLEAFLAKNFYKKKDLSISEIMWGHWSNRKINKQGNPYGLLFGHHFFPTHSNFKAPGIYIIRDGRAVAYSIWKTHNFLHKDIDGKISFSDFLNTPLDWYGSPSKKSDINITIFEHWEKHCSDWLDFSEHEKKLLIIFYEDLVHEPFKTYLKIKRFHFRFKSKIPIDKLDHIKKPVGLLPNSATTNSFKTVMYPSHIKLFNDCIKHPTLKAKYGI